MLVWVCWIARFSSGFWLIFTLTDTSFHYSSEKNEQAHGGRESQIKGSKPGFGSFYGKQTFLWVRWYFCWNVLGFSFKKKKVSSSAFLPGQFVFIFGKQRKRSSFPKLNISLHGPLYKHVFIHMHCLLLVSVFVILCSMKQTCCRVTKLETQKISVYCAVMPCSSLGTDGSKTEANTEGGNTEFSKSLDCLVALKLLLQAEMQ